MLSRRALLGSGVGMLAAAGIGAGAYEGVRSGQAGRLRQQVPPDATDHPGLRVGAPASSSVPVIQVFADPSWSGLGAWVGHTQKAMHELASSGKVALVLRLHGNLEGLNRLACADMVGQLWPAWCGTTPVDERYRTLVDERACWEWCSLMSQSVLSSGVYSPQPFTYRNGTLVDGLSASTVKAEVSLSRMDSLLVKK